MDGNLVISSQGNTWSAEDPKNSLYPVNTDASLKAQNFGYNVGRLENKGWLNQNSILKISIGFLIGAIVVGSIVLIIWLIYHFTKCDASKKLPTPLGQMTAISGPYHDLNAIDNIPHDIPTNNGPITINNYYNRDLYAKYGLRAVIVKNGAADKDTLSDINWNTQIYTLYKVEHPPNSSGLEFLISKQFGTLSSPDVNFELVANYYLDYDNISYDHKGPTSSDKPLNKSGPLIISTYLSYDTEPLIITESSNPDMNKSLIPSSTS